MFIIGFCAYVGHDWLLRPRGRLFAGAGLLMIPLAAYVRTLDGFEWQTPTAATLLFAAPLLCPPMRRRLTLPLSIWLGRLSFSVYLLHFPILFTIGATVFVAAAPLGYLPACLIALIVGGTVTFAAAELFERFVDRRAIAFARRVSMLMGRPGRLAPPTAGGGSDLASAPRPISPRDFPG
jgi:peptidoglycan/LPS O-acetylase OafA/YrhL